MDIITASDKLKQLFSESWLNKVARQQGFIQRLRDILPLRLVASLVASMGDGKTDAIAEIHRCFNGMHSLPTDGVAYKPFHNRLRQAGFPKLLKTVTERAMLLFREEIERDIPEKFRQFKQILLHDGSSFALHRDLADQFPGRFNKHSPAAVECHMTMSLLDDQPVKLSISADTASERQFLPIAEQLNGCLLLADAGYISSDYMSSVERHGGFFLMRISNTLNPTITYAQSHTGRELPKLVGMRFKALRRRHSRARGLDCDVVWKGYQCRLVSFWHPEEKRYLSWLTNLSREEFSSEQVMKLYRARWQVELVFKELKSYNNLHKFVTRQPHIVEGLIWASLLGLLVKRFIGRVAQRQVGKCLSNLKIAKSSRGWLDPIMKSLATAYDSQLAVDLSWAIDFIAVNCQQAPQSKRNKVNSLDGVFNAMLA
ncbi:IS4 family transposase [Motilimonas pumila]|uniref:IS4 family transposase n=1 Tax=Motilimonas pumila TaxID=2303987 RepID=A0A418Y930_9GAMM|nr:IS4 family transposase [Motilimonas pumila]RJG36034.1 IS4 family transposase [Motilimonas pumila]